MHEMIHLKKSPKPDILIQKESLWKDELMGYVKNGQDIPKSVQNRYSHKKIKEALLKETKEKCAYCESRITAIDYGDIEHIEPKRKVPEKTFDWSNLTVSCGKCNQNKGEYYDIDLPLVNPYTDDPEKDIVFLGAYPSARSQRGLMTVEKLKLDRVELLERRTEHIKKIQPMISLYLSTPHKELKRMLYQDLVDYTRDNQEYSALMKSILATIAMPAESEVS